MSVFDQKVYILKINLLVELLEIWKKKPKIPLLSSVIG